MHYRPSSQVHPNRNGLPTRRGGAHWAPPQSSTTASWGGPSASPEGTPPSPAGQRPHSQGRSRRVPETEETEPQGVDSLKQLSQFLNSGHFSISDPSTHLMGSPNLFRQKSDRKFERLGLTWKEHVKKRETNEVAHIKILKEINHGCAA